MAKRKVALVTIDEDDVNDGSGSDDSREDYKPRTGVERLHHVPNEAIYMGSSGRVRSTFTTAAVPASPSKKTRTILNPDLDPPAVDFSSLGEQVSGWEQEFSEFDAEYGAGLQQGPRALRDSDNPNEQWVRLDRENFLDEIIRLDGRGEYINQNECARDGCHATDVRYRCRDCLHPCLYCAQCVVAIHTGMPLHHIETWSDGFFKKSSLKSLGLRIQLGHPLGQPCPNPARSAGDDFVIVTAHTIDEVALDFCNCSQSKPRPTQLLRMRLYPATGTNPRSAAMFAALDRFNMMCLESKCSAYEFYNSLARETDNTGLEPSRERYEEFLRMTRQWDNLHLLKRAARGHDPGDDRIGTTMPGECALLCPACPQPGKNLPPDWKMRLPRNGGFLYALFLALDADFCLKRKDVSSEEKDPVWARETGAEHFVAHDAVDKPDRESLGTASSGIGTVDCARHNMKRPNGVGDLQKGERYLNMDYMFFMSLAGSPIKRLYIFDFDDVQFKDGEKYVVFLIPKFHLPAHIELCNIMYSFNLTPCVGRTDGEAPERGWADANRLASSTSISGPGARRDKLDTHFQDWNWKKIGKHYWSACKKPVPLMLETSVAQSDVEASFPLSAVATWTEMAVAWEDDVQKPNPFATTVTHDGLKEVKKKLAMIASEDVEHERVRGEMHNTEMLAMGLQLEEQQRALATHTKLRRKIDAWMEVQQLFIPEVALLREREDAARKRVAATQAMPGLRAQDMKLWLPSAIGRSAQCDPELFEYEYMLRKGQAFEALEEIRNQLLVRTHEYKFKDRAVRGVRGNTRSATRIKAIDARIQRAAEQYRAARAALVSLSSTLDRIGTDLNHADWKQHLHVLKEEHIRSRPGSLFGDEERRRGRKSARLDPVQEAERAARRAEEKMPMSWIWLAQAGSEPAAVVHNEALRLEWAKTRARAMRYSEEVDLLQEEMRRVVQFMDWRRDRWRSLVGLRAHRQHDAALREGHSAYALKQAWYMDGLSTRFQTLWKDVPAFLQQASTLFHSPEDDIDEQEEMEEGHGMEVLSD
ncbi:hypothetical protein B0H13DRAFT_2342938 [Mycena leptocephala]|nr:hypothetical protein B0H13DRAFT_2342938 [Mycena leptocephala]